MKLLHLSLSLYILNLAEGAVLSVKSPAETKYTTIQQALDAAKAGDTILVYPGTYAEKLVISKDSITLQGSSYPSTNPAENTASISFSTPSSTTVDDDHSATLLVTASNFKAYNLNITNGAASDTGASVAVSSVGQNNGFYALGIHGYQGTFYAHLGSAFIGRSYIQGTVDFVFGRNGNAWFQGCTLGPVKAQGTITSQGRLTGTDDGYFVFDQAKIAPGKNAAPGTKGSVFLGRPWSDYARVVFQNSDEGDVITSAGWKPYTIGQSTRNLLCGEYANSNADGPRVSWAQTLRSAVSISTILPGYNKWVDSSFVGMAA